MVRRLHWEYRRASISHSLQRIGLICSSSPFFYKTAQAPKYNLGIGSLLVCNCIEFVMFFAFRFAFIYENRKKRKAREGITMSETDLNATAFQDLTDKQNIKCAFSM